MNPPSAVLVAISIPIFTAQLEKSREAADLANIRSAYAECSATVLTGEKNTGSSVTYTAANTSTKAPAQATMDVALTQQEDGWKTSDPKCGNVTLTNDIAKAGKTVTVTVKADGSAPTFTVK